MSKLEGGGVKAFVAWPRKNFFFAAFPNSDELTFGVYVVSKRWLVYFICLKKRAKT